MIERHWEGIAAYCRPENKVVLGFVEGLNNKVRVLQRRAYGLRTKSTSGSRSSPACCRRSDGALMSQCARIHPHDFTKSLCLFSERRDRPSLDDIQLRSVATLG